MRIKISSVVDNPQAILLYDTPSRSKRVFEPLQPGKVKMYSCGPTVWNHAHIGNYRSFLFSDVLKRYLRYRGFEVEQVMNLTDVDDRIVEQVSSHEGTLEEYVETYIDGFFEDLDALKFDRADFYPRATAHVPEMVELIQRLVDKGAAYERAGSVYFSISAFPSYGEFAHLDARGRRAGVRVDSDDYDKDDVRDFVLWKAWTEADGEVAWDSPFGRGRPGWHIECSCMSMKYLGETFDIHTGGLDLVFPHHQNEIAQSEAATGKPLARYWMHNAFVDVEGLKMSKSLGNELNLKEIATSGPDLGGYRYLIVTSHYRTALNVSREALDAAISARQRINRLYGRLYRTRAAAPPASSGLWAQQVQAGRQGFCTAMDDDLNVPRAMAAVFGLANPAEKAVDSMDESDAAIVAVFLEEVDSVLGILDEPEEGAVEPELPEELRAMIEERQQARKAKDWETADRLRDALSEAGIEVEDTPEGPKWSRRSQEDVGQALNRFRPNE
ncbi:MAG: cysteine--tRNA ligase [Candidatus Latescibacterota bacterium]|nr:cysteine--tRNA ligase [Candidatus Latescibacterota bacterium]